MESLPPAKTILDLPAWISLAPNIMALLPEEHAVLIMKCILESVKSMAEYIESHREQL